MKGAVPANTSYTPDSIASTLALIYACLFLFRFYQSDDITLILEHSLPLAQWGANTNYFLSDFHFHSPPVHTGEIFQDSDLEVDLFRVLALSCHYSSKGSVCISLSHTHTVEMVD